MLIHRVFFEWERSPPFRQGIKTTTTSCLRTKKTALHNWSRLRSKKRSRIHQKYSQNAPKIAPKSSQRPPQSSQRAPQELHSAPQKPPKLPTWSPKRPRGVQGVPEETSGTHFGSILTQIGPQLRTPDVEELIVNLSKDICSEGGDLRAVSGPKIRAWSRHPRSGPPPKKNNNTLPSPL